MERAEDRITVDGQSLEPEPFEASIRAIDGVTGAALLSRTNSRGVDRLHVFIERTDASLDARVNPLLVPILGPRFSGFVVHYFDQFPRDAAGAVDRAALRDSLPAPTAG